MTVGTAGGCICLSGTGWRLHIVACPVAWCCDDGSLRRAPESLARSIGWALLGSLALLGAIGALWVCAHGWPQ